MTCTDLEKVEPFPEAEIATIFCNLINIVSTQAAAATTTAEVIDITKALNQLLQVKELYLSRNIVIPLL